MIAVMGYAFRSKNEGNDIIEKLSYYPLVQQMFTRFMIVMALQLAITLPLSFVILGSVSSVLYLMVPLHRFYFSELLGLSVLCGLDKKSAYFWRYLFGLLKFFLKSNSNSRHYFSCLEMNIFTYEYCCIRQFLSFYFAVFH